MAKWADYCISRVRYNAEHSHIIKVEALADLGETLGSAQEMTRNDVISAIGNGKTFVTVTRNTAGNFAKGKDVHIITVNGVKYLRTDQNQRTADNLENLPEF